MAEWGVPYDLEHVHGQEEIPLENDELVVLCVVRDGEPWVSAFVEHYFALGAKHLVFLDNESKDGTVSAASGYDGVTVLRTGLPFKALVAGTTSGQTYMRRYLIERFGQGRWSLCVDIDELFDYPYSDIVGLGSLLGYLDGKSYTAVRTNLLDMFPEEPLSRSTQKVVEDLKQEYRFYDISRLAKTRAKRGQIATNRNNTVESDDVAVGLRGGIRSEIFGYQPMLTKYPLIFSDGTLEHTGPHMVNHARVADLTCVLLHYKLYAFSLRYYWYRAVEYKKDGRWMSQREYAKLTEVLEHETELKPKLETSRELASVDDLIENGFLVASTDYLAWVCAEERRNFSQSYPRVGHQTFADALLESRRQERAKALELGRIERQLAAHQREEWAKTEEVQSLRHKLVAKTKRIRSLRHKLSAQAEARLALERQVSGMRQKIPELEKRLSDLGQSLRGSKQRAQRLSQQNNRLRQQLGDLTSSPPWRLLSIIHHGKERVKHLVSSKD